MSNPFGQLTNLYQLIKDVDMDKFSELATKVDLKELIEKVGKLKEAQLKAIMNLLDEFDKENSNTGNQ